MSRKDIEIMDIRLEIYNRDNYTCQYPDCNIKGFDNLQLAHRIGQGHNLSIENYFRWFKEINLTKKFIEIILNHKFNLVSSCAKHNDYFNIGFKNEATIKLLNKIWLDIVEK